MTGTFQYRQDVLQDQSGEASLHRLAALAAELGAEQTASTARSIAERISEGRFYVACVGQFKRGESTHGFAIPLRCPNSLLRNVQNSLIRSVRKSWFWLPQNKRFWAMDVG
jgi:hypothetical protein